jgi:thiol-disulfide isomerase/thioredoxin
MVAAGPSGPGTESGLQAGSSHLESTPAASVRAVRRLALAALLVAASCGPSGPRPGVVEVSGRAPAVRGPLVGDPGVFSPAAYRGAVLVVNFFNPSCGPCREEQPRIVASWRALRRDGVAFVGVHYVGGGWPRSTAAVERYARELGVRYPLVEDPDSALADAFGIGGIPSTVVVDAAGQMRLRVLGPVEKGELEDLVGRVRPPQ